MALFLYYLLWKFRMYFSAFNLKAIFLFSWRPHPGVLYLTWQFSSLLSSRHPNQHPTRSGSSISDVTSPNRKETGSETSVYNNIGTNKSYILNASHINIQTLFPGYLRLALLVSPIYCMKIDFWTMTNKDFTNSHESAVIASHLTSYNGERGVIVLQRITRQGWVGYSSSPLLWTWEIFFSAKHNTGLTPI